MEKKAKKERKRAEMKMNKVQREAEKEVTALQEQVAAANKRAKEKEKLRKDEELKRGRASKAAEVAQISEGIAHAKLARQKMVNESLRRQSEKQKASFEAKCAALC